MLILVNDGSVPCRDGEISSLQIHEQILTQLRDLQAPFSQLLFDLHNELR